MPPARPATLQAVLFDMDGLLVDSEPLWFQVESSVMARLGGRWSPADQQALIGGSLQRTVSYLLDRAAPADGRPARTEVANWLVHGMTELVLASDLPLLPGAAELIAETAAAGLPYALVTSSHRQVMEAVLKRTGLSFPVTVCAADVARNKPDPEPYRLAVARLGVDPGRCVALEDSPNGVASAEGAGCLVVAVPSMTPIEARPGRLVASSLAEMDLGKLRRLVSPDGMRG
jgi:HAD superfamily hydrolase (TIGR01509 family)